MTTNFNPVPPNREFNSTESPKKEQSIHEEINFYSEDRVKSQVLAIINAGKRIAVVSLHKNFLIPKQIRMSHHLLIVPSLSLKIYSRNQK